MLTFLKNHENKPVYATNLESFRFLLRLAYLADIFSALNDLCISLQGQGMDVISSMEKITVFKWKLTLWLKRVPKGSFDHFPKFNELRESMEGDKNVLSDIENHLTLLKSKFDSIFPAEKVSPSWVQNPFLVNVNEVEEKLQEEILDLKASGAAEMMFTAINLTEFWLLQTEAFRNLSRIALNLLQPFSMAYLCKQGFSTLMHMKTKEHNRLKSVNNQMRVCLSGIVPRFELVVENHQMQESH